MAALVAGISERWPLRPAGALALACLTARRSAAAARGHLLSYPRRGWGGGHWVAIALVVIAGLAVAVSLIVWAPLDCRAAGWRRVTGLTLMIMFAPASRFGYPLGLSGWLLLSRARGGTMGVSTQAAAEVTDADWRVPYRAHGPGPLQ